MQYKVTKICKLEACNEEFFIGENVIVECDSRFFWGTIVDFDSIFLKLHNPNDRHPYDCIELAKIIKISHCV